MIVWIQIMGNRFKFIFFWKIVEKLKNLLAKYIQHCQYVVTNPYREYSCNTHYSRVSASRFQYIIFINESFQRTTIMKSYKRNAIIEKDEHGYYAYCPELEGCCSQGRTLDETMANIREAISLYLETLTKKEREALIHRECITSSLEVCIA